jgi:hypothetical protein
MEFLANYGNQWLRPRNGKIEKFAENGIGSPRGTIKCETPTNIEKSPIKGFARVLLKVENKYYACCQGQSCGFGLNKTVC